MYSSSNGNSNSNRGTHILIVVISNNRDVEAHSSEYGAWKFGGLLT